MVFYLCGDVGGTNSRLQLFELRADGSTHQVAKTVFPSKKYSHLSIIIKQFLEETALSAPPLAACIAVAGPVKNNTCHVTNLNWSLNGDELAAALSIRRFLLINDFAAIGFGLLALRDEDKILLNKDAKPVPAAPIACLGAGTGLGEVYLTHNGKNYDVRLPSEFNGATCCCHCEAFGQNHGLVSPRFLASHQVWPCEGGHTDYAPRNQVEFDLLKYVASVHISPILFLQVCRDQNITSHRPLSTPFSAASCVSASALSASA